MKTQSDSQICVHWIVIKEPLARHVSEIRDVVRGVNRPRLASCSPLIPLLLCLADVKNGSMRTITAPHPLLRFHPKQLMENFIGVETAQNITLVCHVYLISDVAGAVPPLTQ